MSPISAYGTHFPILAGAMAEVASWHQSCPGDCRQANILELGAGHFSTPMLHYMATPLDWHLTTMETNVEWLPDFSGYASENHAIKHVTRWADEPLEGTDWDLVFVDCQPGEERAELVRRLRHAKLIVVHDTETDYATGADYKLEPVFKEFSFRSDFRRYRPYTTVVSNFFTFFIEEEDRVWKPSPELEHLKSSANVF